MRHPRSPAPVVLWFGLLGAPAAWALQHVTAYALTEAACDKGGGGFPLDAWTIAVTAAAAAIALLAGACSVAIYRATRDAGDEPPAGRIHFLATLGITLTPLFVCIILMGGLGTVFLPDCRQG